LSLEFREVVSLYEHRTRGNYKNMYYFKFTVGAIVFMTITF